MQKSSSFPIKRVQIIASFLHIESKSLEDIVRLYLDKNFFKLNTVSLNRRLTRLPWVHFVSIRRVWPDKIVILIEEEVPVAIWNDNFLLNHDGEVFVPDKSTFPLDLPKLTGPNDKLKDILGDFFAMQKLLDPLNYKITHLNVDRQNFWELILNNKLKLILGQKELLPRLKLFTKSFSKIQEKSDKIPQKVDLRYKHGLAVKFRE